MPAILAKKLGMTQLFKEDGSVARVTVLEAGPCPVTAVRSTERDGYDAVQLAFGAAREKHLTKADSGICARPTPPRCATSSSSTIPRPGLRTEARRSVTVDAVRGRRPREDLRGLQGQGLPGHDPHATSFKSGPKSHGSHNVRAPGSIRASATPARVMKGIRGPGQMGNHRVTQPGLEVVAVDPAQNLLMVRGSVPGPRGGVVEVRVDG